MIAGGQSWHLRRCKLPNMVTTPWRYLLSTSRVPFSSSNHNHIVCFVHGNRYKLFGKQPEALVKGGEKGVAEAQKSSDLEMTF